MRFNHDAQLLALASKTNKDQLKLVGHFASCWPLSLARLTKASSIPRVGSPADVLSVLKLADTTDPAAPRDLHRLFEKK